MRFDQRVRRTSGATDEVFPMLYSNRGVSIISAVTCKDRSTSLRI